MGSSKTSMEKEDLEENMRDVNPRVKVLALKGYLGEGN